MVDATHVQLMTVLVVGKQATVRQIAVRIVQPRNLFDPSIIRRGHLQLSHRIEGFADARVNPSLRGVSAAANLLVHAALPSSFVHRLLIPHCCFNLLHNRSNRMDITVKCGVLAG
ncbi:hypothetical protein A6F59_20005 [Prescottella equi]|nr:hypothetical protein A6F59_20005 [Prescottella equi]